MDIELLADPPSLGDYSRVLQLVQQRHRVLAERLVRMFGGVKPAPSAAEA